jgi:hypothetical protein
MEFLKSMQRNFGMEESSGETAANYGGAFQIPQCSQRPCRGRRVLLAPGLSSAAPGIMKREETR